MHSQELRANREQHNGYCPGCNTLIFLHTTSFHIRIQTSSGENLWEERGGWGMMLRLWTYESDSPMKPLKPKVQGTDSVTLGVNFKELSQANQFPALQIYPSVLFLLYSSLLILSWKVPYWQMFEGSNPRDRSELVQKTGVHSWEIWVDLGNLAKECLGAS